MDTAYCLAMIALALAIAQMCGQAVVKLKLPAIMGWLIAGILLGAYVLNVITPQVTEVPAYHLVFSISTVLLGIMIGNSLVWANLKKYGAAILKVTFCQFLATFVLIAVTFSIVFYFLDFTWTLAIAVGIVAGGIAPMPVAAIIREYKTKGPLTDTVLPILGFNSIVYKVPFFIALPILQSIYATSSESASLWSTLLAQFVAPIVFGAAFGFVAALVVPKKANNWVQMLAFVAVIVVMFVLGTWINGHYKFFIEIMVGLGFGIAYINKVSPSTHKEVSVHYDPIQNIGFMVVLVFLGFTFDPKSILDYWMWIILYVLVRWLGIWAGATFGAKIAHTADSVRQNIGVVLFPHSGMSVFYSGLIMTALADATDTAVLGGTEFIFVVLAAAGILNELVCLPLVARAFHRAGEAGADFGSKPANKPVKVR